MESFKMLELIEHIPKSDSFENNQSIVEMHSLLDVLKDRDVIVQASLYASIIGY